MLCFVSAGTRGSHSCTSCSSHQTHSPRHPWLHGRREWVQKNPSIHTHTLPLTYSLSLSLYLSFASHWWFKIRFIHPRREIKVMKGSFYLHTTIFCAIFLEVTWGHHVVSEWPLNCHPGPWTVIFALCQTVTLLCTVIWNVYCLTSFFWATVLESSRMEAPLMLTVYLCQKSQKSTLLPHTLFFWHGQFDLLLAPIITTQLH